MTSIFVRLIFWIAGNMFLLIYSSRLFNRMAQSPNGTSSKTVRQVMMMSTGGRQSRKSSSSGNKSGANSSPTDTPDNYLALKPKPVKEVFDITGRPITLNPPFVPGCRVIQSFGIKGGLIWFVPESGQMLMREGFLTDGSPAYMCCTTNTMPKKKRPKSRCSGKLYPPQPHTTHKDPVNGPDCRTLFFNCLYKGFIAFYRKKLTNHQLKLLDDFFHMAVYHKKGKQCAFPNWISTLDNVLTWGSPFYEELKRSPQWPDVIPLMQHPVATVDAALELACHEYFFRYGDLAEALGQDIRIPFQELRGTALPDRNVPYTLRSTSLPGKFTSSIIANICPAAHTCPELSL